MNRRDFSCFVIVMFVMVIAVSIYLSFVLKDCKMLEAKNTELQKQLQTTQQQLLDLQQQKAGYTEGKYTLITNLSSSIYLNRIPNNFDKIYPWEDVNGVKGFDTISGGLYLRYVEGHIEWPQLSLYAPEMHLEVVSDSKWPKE